MAKFKEPTIAGTQAVGSNFETVYVLSVDTVNRRAFVTTSLHKNITVTLSRLPGKGSLLPTEGETWVISQMFGGWTFLFCINPPSFRGTTAARPANPQLGQYYFDTTLNKPIWFGNSTWVDATGTSV